MAKSKFRPLHDRIVVKRIDAEEKTKGGIIIPDTAKEKPSQGEVVAVGPGGRDEAGKLTPMGVKAGDRVLFGKWSGTEVKLDGDDLAFLRLLLDGVGNDDAALGLRFGIDALHHDTVVQRAEFGFGHDVPSSVRFSGPVHGNRRVMRAAAGALMAAWPADLAIAM